MSGYWYLQSGYQIDFGYRIRIPKKIFFPPDTGLDTKIVDIFGYQNSESVNFQGNYKQKKILGYQIKYLQNIRILNMDQIRFPDTRLKIRIPKFWKLLRIPVSAHPWTLVWGFLLWPTLYNLESWIKIWWNIWNQFEWQDF